MKDIRIYDFEFNLLCIMPDIISSQWHILYNSVGTYEGVFRLRDNISDIILSNRYLIITQGDYQAICTGKIVKDTLTVCGRTVNWILTKRVRPPFKTRDIFGEEFTTAEEILLYCLRLGLTEPPKIDENGFEIPNSINEDRIIKNFILPNPLGSPKLTNHFWRITAHDLSTLSTDLCQKLNRGHRVIFDIQNKCWRYEFIEPRENNILISKESKTAYEISFSEDLLGYAEGGWYSERENEEDNQEFENTWRYIKKDSLSGIYAWDTVLHEIGKSAASDALLKKQYTKKIDASLRNLTYGKDYFLGDIIPVYIKIGNFDNLSKYMVTGIDILMSPSGYSEQPILSIYNEKL